MVECRRCGTDAERLHPIPADVLTRAVIADVGAGDGREDVLACGDCVRELTAE